MPLVRWQQATAFKMLEWFNETLVVLRPERCMGGDFVARAPMPSQGFCL
jgi:hypothetical protein